MTMNILPEESLIRKIRYFYFSKTLLWGLVWIGIIFHLAQYLFNRSLWVDEASVAMRILDSSYSDFWQPFALGLFAISGQLIYHSSTLLFVFSEGIK
jgi:hypothetical protein